MTHMKTTVEIADPLFSAAKELAAKQGTTLRALVELGLRRVLEDEKRVASFKLRDVGFEGRGLTPEFRDAGWEKIRDAIYEGHGA